MERKKKEEVLNGYVEMLLEEDIEEDKLRQHIEIFSRFLGYTNSDYKYNGTYLCQYVDEFIKVYHMLKVKHEKYLEIFMGLLKLGKEFVLTIDKMFYGEVSFSSGYVRKYVGFSVEDVARESLDISVVIEISGSNLLFHKEYEKYENEISKQVCDDVKKYWKRKEKKENGEKEGVI